MRGSSAVDILLWHCWWRWTGANNSAFDLAYRGFNVIEGALWLVLAALVWYRYAVHRKSLLEIAYSLAFVAFGLTDFLEARALCSWLIWLKGGVLITLLLLRRIVIRRYYPASRTY